jgi:hypothetical protein
VAEPVTLRDDNLVPGLLVVRFGVVTLTDASLQKSVEECHQRWGFWGFSVFEVPNRDYAMLARLRPNIVGRRQMMTAEGEDLVDSGFPLLPTLEAPHWTVVLATATPEWFARVREHFHGPLPNPAYRPS